MAIKTVKNIVDAVNNGQQFVSRFRKIPNASAPIAVWQDLAMSSGNPNPHYYASSPLDSVQISYSSQRGIYHGPDVAPKRKYLKKTCFSTNSATFGASTLLLCDYLLYYPFIDENISGEEIELNNIAGLPRYVSGDGVRIMLVSSAQGAGGSSCQITYTNQDGVNGRVTPAFSINAGGVNGSILTSNGGSSANYAFPFVPLFDGDTGVRSVQSIKFATPDTGLLTIVLVKPLATAYLNEQTAASEKDYLINNGFIMPEIKDNAYLNYIICSNGTFSGSQIYAEMEFIFN